MATMQRRLVHKQFNSPINLYSQRNIQETLDRELKQLSNGAIGIDFDDPSTTKPPSLAKSAVLQALEEEERQQQSRGKGLKRVAWPPSAEGGDEYEQVQQQQQPQQQQQYYQQPQPHQQAPASQQYQHPAQQQQQQPRERIIPIQRPEQQHQQQYQPQPTQAFQPLVAQTQQQPPQQFYQPEQQQQQQQLHQHQPEPVPFFTTLRSEPPMSQEPAPVYQTQPVAAIYQGGSNMRGDQKWPPADVKKQSELENEERRRLAQEPAFRPRKVQKDYSSFFAKNALNATYPGYRAPPGTQHHS